MPNFRLIAMKLLAPCALAAALPFSVQADTAKGQDGLKLERVVMLMRHGVRSPTQAKVTPDGTADRPWPKWPVDYGELTPHGYAAIKLLGAWDRENWAARGLLPAQGCPDARDVAVSASAKQRTQDTAHALLEGMAPNCNISVSIPKSKKDDVEFHSLESAAVPFDAGEALRAVQARVPAGGMEGEVRRNAELFALLNRALGCKAKACDLSQMPAGLNGGDGGAPSIGDPFDVASTAAQTFLLEYLEGMPKQDVAWGRLGREDIERLLRFHSLKYVYEARTPYVAARGASLLTAHMLKAMEDGPKLTVLVGHDTNIALLGGFLDLHWKIPSYPDDDPPPGGALGFEILSDAAGTQYVRAFYRVQTMDQIRGLQPLGRKNAPDYVYMDIPGCAKRCRLDDFVKQVRAKLIAPAGADASHAGDISYSTKTPYAPQQDGATYQKPPAGFSPVFVEHVARHGSRAMTSSKSGDLSLQIWEKARAEGALTPLGEAFGPVVKDILAANEKLGYGNLSARGQREHREMAVRVAQRLPALFKRIGERSERIDVVSSGKDRAVDSARNFAESLAAQSAAIAAQINPARADPDLLYFHKSAKNADYQAYLADDAQLHTVQERLQGLEPIHKAARHLLERLYKPAFVDELVAGKLTLANSAKGKSKNKDGGSAHAIGEVDAAVAVYDLYQIAPGMSGEGDWNMPRFVTHEDADTFAYLDDAQSFYEKGPGFQGRDITYRMAGVLLDDFFAKVDDVIAARGNFGAVFRFTHAEDIIPLAALMHLPGSTKQNVPEQLFDYANNPWRGAYVAPLGANVQWDVFGDGKRYLVRMLYDEKETAFKDGCKPISPGSFFYDYGELRRCFDRPAATGK